jgi:uncharacterized protein (TIGR02145 family)
MKTIVTFGIIICGYAFSQAQVCDPSIAPSNLQAFVSSTAVQLTWDHTPYSGYALIEGTTPGGESIRKLIASSMPGTEPSALIVPATRFSNGTHTWTVKAACSLFPPYSLSAASDVDSFDVGEPFICGDSIVDIEGNTYPTVMIGSKCWMAENLKTERYNNGAAIPYGVASGGDYYSVYLDDFANKDTYGLLYSWYAATDVRGVCPVGWSVSDESDVLDLLVEAGGITSNTNACRLKTVGSLDDSTGLWSGSNTCATNSLGFSLLPAGVTAILYGFGFNDLNLGAYILTTTDIGIDVGTDEYVYYRARFNDDGVDRFAIDKEWGMSIRCVKD